RAEYAGASSSGPRPGAPAASCHSAGRVSCDGRADRNKARRSPEPRAAATTSSAIGRKWPAGTGRIWTREHVSTSGLSGSLRHRSGEAALAHVGEAHHRIGDVVFGGQFDGIDAGILEDRAKMVLMGVGEGGKPAAKTPVAGVDEDLLAGL